MQIQKMNMNMKNEHEHKIEYSQILFEEKWSRVVLHAPCTSQILSRYTWHQDDKVRDDNVKFSKTIV